MEALTPHVTKDKESEILFKFTFELRKRVLGLSKLFSCINEMQENSHYELSFGLVSENSRFLWIKIYEHSSEHPTLQFNRKLKSISTDVTMAITKLNFAIAHDAKVVFEVADDETHLTATILAPQSKRSKETILENFKYL